MNAFCAFAVSLTIVAHFAVRASPYILRKTWVRNYIKFQYTFGNGTAGDIKAIGCVPTNQKNGAVIKVGETFNESEFQYVCAESEDGVMSYEANACTDPAGEVMKIGEAVTLRNGTLLLTCQLHAGVVKKIIQQLSGCMYNDTLYGESETWVEPLKSSTWVGGSPMTALLMQCFRPHYSYFEAQVAGCVTAGEEIPLHNFGYVDDRYVHCVELDSGEVDLIYIEEEDLACTLDGKKFPHNETWFDEERSALLTCQYRDVIKIECMVGNETVAIGQMVDIDNGCSFACHPQANLYLCDKKLGDFAVVEKNEPGDDGDGPDGNDRSGGNLTSMFRSPLAVRSEIAVGSGRAGNGAKGKKKKTVFKNRRHSHTQLRRHLKKETPMPPLASILT